MNAVIGMLRSMISRLRRLRRGLRQPDEDDVDAGLRDFAVGPQDPSRAYERLRNLEEERKGDD